jgi:phospholipase C
MGSSLCAAAVTVASLFVGAHPALAAGSPCGSLAAGYDPTHPPHYDHVVVLMEENWSYNAFMASSQAPYLKQLNATCGSEKNFHNATHSSQPNYMAATSGIASGVGVHVANNNVFHQVQAAGRTWRSFEESMPTACLGSSVGFYKPGHNPAVFYDDLRTPTNTCSTWDVPLDPTLSNDLQADTLPAYSWVTPNLCHAFYWVPACPTPQGAKEAQGDTWLSAMLPRFTALPSYQAGKTLIIITFDEGQGGTAGVDCTDPSYYVNHPDCHIPTVVVSPYIASGRSDSSDQNLYSLLGTTEDILGLARLGRAVGQPSMRPGLRF